MRSDKMTMEIINDTVTCTRAGNADKWTCRFPDFLGNYGVHEISTGGSAGSTISTKPVAEMSTNRLETIKINLHGENASNSFFCTVSGGEKLKKLECY